MILKLLHDPSPVIFHEEKKPCIQSIMHTKDKAHETVFGELRKQHSKKVLKRFSDSEGNNITHEINKLISHEKSIEISVPIRRVILFRVDTNI